jgi:hypothetical protein
VPPIGWGIASQIVHPLTHTSRIADKLMRDNDKFNKSLAREYDEAPTGGGGSELPLGASWSISTIISEDTKEQESFFKRFKKYVRIYLIMP